MSEKYVVVISGTPIFTTSSDVAEHLNELKKVLKKKTVEGLNVDYVFKALSFLKKFYSQRQDVIDIINDVEQILKSDLEAGKVKLW